MTDLWNIPQASISSDIITARVAEALRYSFSLLEQMQSARSFARKNILSDMSISKDTLRIYTSPVIDQNYRLISGPTKIAVFHGIMEGLGVRPSQFYEAAETSLSYCEFIRRISQIVLAANALQNASSNDNRQTRNGLRTVIK
jgi:hypothetical protein